MAKADIGMRRVRAVNHGVILTLVAFTIGGLAAIDLAASAVPGAAETPDQASRRALDFPGVVDAVKPTVIGINAKVVESRDRLHHSQWPGGDSSPFEAPDEGHGMPEEHELVGSGFLISADGYAVTNAHVVEGSDTTEIETADAKTYAARVVGIDPATDVALLKIDGRNDFTAAELSSRPPRVGEWVLAIGNPFGLGGTVTAGIVSADKRNVGNNFVDDFIQIDAPVNRGNSGGPAFDLDGKVIGISAMIVSPSGGSVGIAFAIPAETLKATIPELKEKGFVQHGWIGVQVQSVTSEIAESLGLPEAAGALVQDARGDAPAARAGIASGDVILSLDGEPIKDAHDLVKRIAGARPGDSVKLGLRRNAQERVVAVTLGELPQSAATKPPDHDAQATAPTLGLNLAPARNGPQGKGVLVARVDPHGSAVKRGLATGDIILEIGGRSVSTPREAEAALSKARGEGKRFVLMRLKSLEGTRFVAVPPDPM